MLQSSLPTSQLTHVWLSVCAGPLFQVGYEVNLADGDKDPVNVTIYESDVAIEVRHTHRTLCAAMVVSLHGWMDVLTSDWSACSFYRVTLSTDSCLVMTSYRNACCRITPAC